MLGASLVASLFVQDVVKRTLRGSFKSPAKSDAGRSPSPLTRNGLTGAGRCYLMLGASLVASLFVQTFVEALMLTK